MSWALGGLYVALYVLKCARILEEIDIKLHTLHQKLECLKANTTFDTWQVTFDMWQLGITSFDIWQKPKMIIASILGSLYLKARGENAIHDHNTLEVEPLFHFNLHINTCSPRQCMLVEDCILGSFPLIVFCVVEKLYVILNALEKQRF